MENIAPELLAKMQSEFNKEYLASNTISKLSEKYRNKTLTLHDADIYAMEIGKIREKVILKHYKDVDPVMYNSIGEQILRPQLKNNYDLIIKQASKAQEIANKKAKLGIKPAVPKFDEDKAVGLIEKLKAAESYTDVEKAINYNIQTFGKGIVSDSVQANAELHYEAGLSPVIKRIAVGRCCDWCNRMAGIYDYESVSNKGNDVYRFHANCRCYIIYDPNDGSRRINTKTQRQI